MKTHLFKKEVSLFCAKTQCGRTLNVDNIETIDYTKVTCEHCKKTEQFKQLEETEKLKQEVKQIGVDIMGSHHRDETRKENIELKPNQNDPAIDLLNQLADLIRSADLTVEEKLNVIDFIESRVRWARL